MKHVFPRVSKTATTDFRFPNDNVHCSDICWFMQRYPLRMSDVDRLAIEAGRDAFEFAQGEMEGIRMPDYRPPAYQGIHPGKVGRSVPATGGRVVGSTKETRAGERG